MWVVQNANGILQKWIKQMEESSTPMCCYMLLAHIRGTCGGVPTAKFSFLSSSMRGAAKLRDIMSLLRREVSKAILFIMLTICVCLWPLLSC